VQQVSVLQVCGAFLLYAIVLACSVSIEFWHRTRKPCDADQQTERGQPKQLETQEVENLRMVVRAILLEQKQTISYTDSDRGMTQTESRHTLARGSVRGTFDGCEAGPI